MIAKALDVNEAWLTGHNVPMERVRTKYPDNVLKIETRKFPVLGTIAAGESKHVAFWDVTSNSMNQVLTLREKLSQQSAPSDYVL